MLEMRWSLVPMDPFSMPTKDMPRGQSPGHGPRRQEAEERVHAKPLAGCAEVGRGAEGVGADEHAALGPPERHLFPAW